MVCIYTVHIASMDLITNRPSEQSKFDGGHSSREGRKNWGANFDWDLVPWIFSAGMYFFIAHCLCLEKDQNWCSQTQAQNYTKSDVGHQLFFIKSGTSTD